MLKGNEVKMRSFLTNDFTDFTAKDAKELRKGRKEFLCMLLVSRRLKPTVNQLFSLRENLVVGWYACRDAACHVSTLT